MNRNVIIIAVFMTLFSRAVFGGPSDLPPIAWGTATNGLQAGIAYHSSTLETTVYARVTLCLRNAGEKPIRILKLSAQVWFWGDQLPLEIRQGRTILKYQGGLLEPPPLPPESAYIILNPGETDSVDVWPVAHNWGLTATDEVDATFVFRNASAENRGLWVGETRSGTIKIKLSSQPTPERYRR